ncbi:hypothetical protein [Pseudoduganella aquatica]|uniref:Uncharacterized protein n=1 Tax=Pseudoduganella aquatica TaxID=2660641 RepID=A0A7X4HER3_9BURK|nr:hypothetical protein [Pseudoduganella aquatica]MYN09202.1 hypothetical protein [Pseudoduganella aquatica]
MLKISLIGRGWFHEAWHHKTSVIGGILAIISLSLAHYAGFLMKVPLQIVAVAGMPLVRGVTATFLFYVFFCAVFARVLASILQLAVLPFIAVTDRIDPAFHRKMDWPHQRRFVRSHSRTIKWEGLIWIGIQSLMFLLMMLSIYVEFAGTWTSVAGLFASIVLVILTGLLRAGFFLQPKPKTFINKIKARRVRAGRASSAAFVTATAALIIIAFFMGVMRAHLLRDQQEHPIVTKEFSGKAAVIASADGALLLLQKQGAEMRYIYSTAEFTASIETKSVFPPLGMRKE